MHVSQIGSNPAPTPALKPKEVTTAPAAANSPTASPGAATAAQASGPATLPAFEDSEISDSATAGKSVESASSSMLGDSNTALLAQANLDPATVLQLLAD
jgi:hypothetical protein